MTDHILLLLIVATIVPSVLLVLPQQSSPRGGSNTPKEPPPPPVEDCPAVGTPPALDCGLAPSLIGKYVDYVKFGSVGVVIGTATDLATWSKHFADRVSFRMLDDNFLFHNSADIVVDCNGGELFEGLFTKAVLRPGGLYFIRGRISETVSETLEDVLTDIHRYYWNTALVVGAERFTPRHGVVRWTRTLEWGMSEAVVFKRMKEFDTAAPD